MGPRSLVVTVLLEAALFASALAADTPGNPYTTRRDTAFSHVPSTKAEYHAPTYTAPPPPSPPAPTYSAPAPPSPHAPTYAAPAPPAPPAASGYKHTEEYTKPYTKEHVWVESKTYAAPPTYTKPYIHPTPTVASLEEALINAGCSNFLAFIKSDTDTWALYNSASVRTVFAPDDASFPLNTTTSPARLRRRELTPEQQQQADLSAETALTDLSALRIEPGTVLSTSDSSANLLGSPQVVVSSVDTITGDVSISSGLGNQVALKSADIPYTNGLVHTTDGLFTVPEPLTLTLAADPSLSIFGSLVAGGAGIGNLTRRTGTAQKLDLTPRVTVFIPSNEAFRATGPVSASQASALVNGHTVVSHSLAESVGYLPDLQNGRVLRTESGSSVVVSVRGGETYVGGARIVQSNIILPNGVAHVLDKVLAPPIQTAAAVPGTVPGAGRAALVAAGVVAMAALPSW